MRTLLALTLAALLTGCATYPSCSVYVIVPLPLPIVACGVDLSIPEAPEEDDDV